MDYEEATSLALLIKAAPELEIGLDFARWRLAAPCSGVVVLHSPS